MIELKNVSKFYYSKGMITSGFSRVNLSLNVGEFVVITGESGSGKSTLLNVISGLDSYEEGEMYIEGKETSHYLASDFEEYRKKYIGNIFQNFNLVSSYTAYQNVELILRINGYSSDEIKAKVNEILAQVGMSEFAKTKVSKLSGGQKQRVAIARALAKDTSIIVADEPTGNLDSESAEDIVKLLSEISRDKLVIVVTHNYDQFEAYATRKIKMHDGKIVEDEVLTQTESAELKHEEDVKNISAGSVFKLGMRNTFNIIPKFILLMIVFIFIVMAVTSEYTGYQHTKAEMSKLGYNDYFMNYSEDRIVLKKEDGSSFTDDDYKSLADMNNISRVVKADILLDSGLYLEDDDFYIDAYPQNIDEFEGEVVYGRLPEKNNEVVIMGYKDDYMFNQENAEGLLGRTFELISWDTSTSVKVKIVGVAYEEGEQINYYYSGRVFMTDKMIDKMMRITYSSNSKIITDVNGTELICEYGSQYYLPVANEDIEEGTILASEEFDYYYSSGKAKGQKVTMRTENMFYDREIEVTVADTYNEKNFSDKTGVNDFEMHDGEIYMNPADYQKLFSKKQYQASVYVENTRETDQTVSELEKAGYVPLALKDTLITETDEIVSVIQVPMTIVSLLAVFFISYFVIQLILRSRSSYFGILRMLGLAKNKIRRIMDVELFIVVNIAYALFLALVILINLHIINIEFIWDLVLYMTVFDYVIMYVILVLMSYLISGKFVRKMFKKTAMGSYREEV